MKLASLAIVLAACGGSPKQPIAQHTPPTPSSALPALYAPLFVDGKSWTMTGELVVGYNDGTGAKTETSKGKVTCSVGNVHQVIGGMSATLSCTSDGFDMPTSPAGTYVGTAKGLWQVDSDFAGNAAALDDKTMLIGAVPKEGRVETPGQDEGFGEATEVVARGKDSGYCVSRTSWGGDEGGWTLCLREGVGVTGGNGFFAGGSTRDAFFGDVPRD